GLLVRKEEGYQASDEKHAALLKDPAHCVAITAAEILGRYGSDAEAEQAVATLIALANFRETDEYSAAYALLVLDELRTARRDLVAPHAAELEVLPVPEGTGVNRRAQDYPRRLKARIEEQL